MHKHMANDSGVNSNITAAWFFQDKANGQRTEVTCPLSRRSWGGTRDKPTSAWWLPMMHVEVMFHADRVIPAFPLQNLPFRRSRFVIN